jgi:hypothetical protein
MRKLLTIKMGFPRGRILFQLGTGPEVGFRPSPCSIRIHFGWQPMILYFVIMLGILLVGRIMGAESNP